MHLIGNRPLFMIQYRVRPGFAHKNWFLNWFSKRLFIEFIGDNTENLMDSLCSALSSLKLKRGKLRNVWFNDEVIQPFKSRSGKFTISIDIYECVNIEAPFNQNAIRKIDMLLQHDSRFEKLEVNLGEYR